MRTSTSALVRENRCSEELGRLCPYPVARNPSYLDLVEVSIFAAVGLEVAVMESAAMFRECSWVDNRTLLNSVALGPWVRSFNNKIIDAIIL